MSDSKGVNTHGGKRKGAGRKAGAKIAGYIAGGLTAEQCAWWARQPGGSNGERLRRIIDRVMAADKPLLP